MSITTQEQALIALTTTTGRVEHLTDRYDSGGAAMKARAARLLADTFAERASIYRQLPKLYSGRKPARWLAQLASSDAALAMELQAESWGQRADAHQAEADRIEQAALIVFDDDGMEYITGRGRVRRTVNGGQR